MVEGCKEDSEYLDEFGFNSPMPTSMTQLVELQSVLPELQAAGYEPFAVSNDTVECYGIPYPGPHITDVNGFIVGKNFHPRLRSLRRAHMHVAQRIGVKLTAALATLIESEGIKTNVKRLPPS